MRILGYEDLFDLMVRAVTLRKDHHAAIPLLKQDDDHTIGDYNNKLWSYVYGFDACIAV